MGKAGGKAGGDGVETQQQHNSKRQGLQDGRNRNRNIMDMQECNRNALGDLCVELLCVVPDHAVVVVLVLLADVASKARGTGTYERLYSVEARAAVQTRRRRALVDVDFTVSTAVSLYARARILRGQHNCRETGRHACAAMLAWM